MKVLFFFLALLCLALFFPQMVSATVVINEVHPIPVEGNEWVELFNTASESASLQGWIVEDQLSSPSVLKQFTDTATISAQGFFVLEVSNKLNNSGDGVVLRNKNGEAVDIMAYSSAQTGQSWSRSPNGSGEFVLQSPTKGSGNFAPLPSPSPTPSPSPLPSPSPTPTVVPSPTPLPTPTPYPSPSLFPSPIPLPLPTNLQLSEIMACPATGESEWVEIYNPDNMFYMLTNWQIKDGVGNTRVFSTTISAQSYAVVSLSSGIINNEGDVIYIDRPDGVRVASAQLPACHKGKSFIFQDGVWRESSAPTKGAANIVSTETVISDTLADETEQEIDNTQEPLPSLNSALPQQKAVLTRSLPLTQLTATESATVSGEVLGAITQEKAPSSFVEEPTPFWYQKYFIFALSLLGFVCIGGSSFYLIQWYTEQYAQNDLEMV